MLPSLFVSPCITPWANDGLQKVADCFSLTHRGSVSSSVRVIEEKIERIGFKKRLNEIEEELNLTKPSWLYI